MSRRIADELPIPTTAGWRYPWDDWTDGATWELIAGQDFGAEMDSFRNRCYGIARERGMKVTIRTVKADNRPALRIRFFDPAPSPGHVAVPAVETNGAHESQIATGTFD